MSIAVGHIDDLELEAEGSKPKSVGCTCTGGENSRTPSHPIRSYGRREPYLRSSGPDDGITVESPPSRMSSWIASTTMVVP
jgi:hypothetical protein